MINDNFCSICGCELDNGKYVSPESRECICYDCWRVEIDEMTGYFQNCGDLIESGYDNVDIVLDTMDDEDTLRHIANNKDIYLED